MNTKGNTIKCMTLAALAAVALALPGLAEPINSKVVENQPIYRGYQGPQRFDGRMNYEKPDKPPKPPKFEGRTLYEKPDKPPKPPKFEGQTGYEKPDKPPKPPKFEAQSISPVPTPSQAIVAPDMTR